jgi:hypothetical protein
MWQFRRSWRLPTHCLVLPVGESPVARNDLADGAQHLIKAIQLQIEGLIARKVEVLWCHAASRRLWRAGDLAPLSPSHSSNSLHLMMGAGFLLTYDPPLAACEKVVQPSWQRYHGPRPTRSFPPGGACQTAKRVRLLARGGRFPVPRERQRRDKPLP